MNTNANATRAGTPRKEIFLIRAAEEICEALTIQIQKQSRRTVLELKQILF